jgi:DNA-directed RNA polymerase subunit beta'
LITTPGRLIFNQIVPESIEFINAAIDKKTIGNLVVRIHEELGNEACVQFLDDIKALGFKYGTQSGISISIADINVKSRRDEIVQKAEAQVRRVNTAYEDDPLTMTAQERERRVLQAWIKASEDVGADVLQAMDKFNPFYMMATSGRSWFDAPDSADRGYARFDARSFGPHDRRLAVKSNFREGLDLHEYFVSTHGARKGLADTALRTADAGI